MAIVAVCLSCKTVSIKYGKKPNGWLRLWIEEGKLLSVKHLPEIPNDVWIK